MLPLLKFWCWQKVCHKFNPVWHIYISSVLFSVARTWLLHALVCTLMTYGFGMLVFGLSVKMYVDLSAMLRESVAAQRPAGPLRTAIRKVCALGTASLAFQGWNSVYLWNMCKCECWSTKRWWEAELSISVPYIRYYHCFLLPAEHFGAHILTFQRCVF